MMSDVGAVDENAFLASFDNVSHINTYSFRDVAAKWKECYKIIENKNEDWKKRVKSLTEIRSLTAASLNYDEFHLKLRELLPAFDKPLKDLRSSVVREACITVAFLSKNLAIKLDYFVEAVLPDLLKLIQSSTKVMATSAIVCIRFILRYTHSPRLISRISEPIFDQRSQLNKSKEIRKNCCEFIYVILQTWPTNSIEKNQTALLNLQRAIKKGLGDADGAARVNSRNAYQEFSNLFPQLAEGLAESLDGQSRKYLNSNSNSSSSSSLNRIPATITKSISFRSNSAIDLHVIKKVNTRDQHAIRSSHKACFSGVSTMMPKTSNQTRSQSSNQKVGRTKGRISVSQPTSRSASPSFGISYTDYVCSNGSTSRSTRHYEKLTTAQKMLLQAREAEAKLFASLNSPPLWCSLKLSRGPDDHTDRSEASSIDSAHALDSHRRPSETISSNGSPCGLYPDFCEPTLKDINKIISNCENVHWNEKREGLQSLQYYLQEGNRLELRDLKRIIDVFTKNFNDPHIKVFSLFLDSLNEVIRCHNEDMFYCLHLLLTRLFNKLGTDLMDSVYSRIMKTLEIIFEYFPADLQLHSAIRFLVDVTETPYSRVELAALNYIIKLTSVVDPSKAFSSNTSDSCKDNTTLALKKLVNWTIADNSKIGSELQRVSCETVVALFTLHPSEIAPRFSMLPSKLERAAVLICKNHCFSKDNNGDELNTYIEELSQSSAKDVSHREQLINVITSMVGICQPDTIVSNFKPLLLTICGLLIPPESSTIKVLSFNLLQTIVERKTVTELLKNISDLIITKTIALADDSSKDVVIAAENCAISLATFLPAESVIRVVVPFSTSEDPPAKLIAIKMLTKTIECSDGAIAMAEIDHIMNALLTAYNDEESLIREAAVFCMAALHEQSEDMKVALEPYFNRLEKIKLKLIQL